MEALLCFNIILLVFLFSNISSATIYDQQNNPNVWSGQCQIGKLQSPIDLIEKQTELTKSGELTFDLKDYDKSIGFIKLYNDGKTIYVTLLNQRILPTVKFNNTEYEMGQFHFHWHASEHAINGVLYDGEIHLVHQDPVNRDILVLGALLKKTFYSNNIISQIFRKSLKTITKFEESSYLYIKSNLKQLLDNINLKKYLTYEGSLTTPVCGEGVRWIVFRDLIKVDKRMIEELSNRFEDRNGEILRYNNRELQDINGRTIYKSYLRAFYLGTSRLRNRNNL
ncbi:carbonic anhydrase 6-like [Condylostylus longicornis]|uniref:carbonic anhydrase 6-like n=1 Tax=Condylostylus longicornis TaxID=2530218 RepID=UPI00244DA795|nr:carbonic anhydrase 6-like [Condylostylus longicornis]